MTNERAIQILEILISIDGDVIIEGEYKKALETAIRSLQQEQPCEDLEKEVEWEWVHREKQEVDLIECAEMDKDEFVRFARHFYELGKANKEDKK